MSATPKRPNILILHTDQHRHDVLGCAGHPDVRTPALDALAADGVRFPDHFCVYPVCTPSRYSLISGLHVHQHLGWSNRSTLPPGLPTVPRLLREAGWRTAAVGKMHYTPTYLDVGFEHMHLSEQDGNGRFDDDYHRYLRDRGLLDAIDVMDQRHEYRQQATPEYWRTWGAMESDLPEEHHSTTWIGQRALEELAHWQEGGGNLLMAGFIKPHHPFDPPAPWSTMYDPETLALPHGWCRQRNALDRQIRGYFPNDELDEPTLRRILAMYYATVSQIDHQVGRILDTLRQRGLYDDTLIVFTSDHGDYLGDHHMVLKGNQPYDALLKVPLLVKYPGQRSAGSVDEALTSTVDLAPTMLREAGLDVPTDWPGVVLAEGPRDYVFAEVGRGRQVGYVVRSHTHKLIAGADRELLFDLRRDPLERENVAAAPSQAANLREHRDALWQWLAFESPTPHYLDEAAPIIAEPNAQRGTEAERAPIIAYHEETFAEYLADRA